MSNKNLKKSLNNSEERTVVAIDSPHFLFNLSPPGFGKENDRLRGFARDTDREEEESEEAERDVGREEEDVGVVGRAGVMGGGK